MRDKLQRYAARLVGEEGTIWSKTTCSAYFNFQGTSVRISDHLPKSGNVNASGATLSIIMTSNPDQYILQQHSTGRLSVVNYDRAKEILRSVSAISDVFRYPVTPFKLEKDFMETLTTVNDNTVLGEPTTSFTKAQMSTIKSYFKQAKKNRLTKATKLRKEEKSSNHLL